MVWQDSTEENEATAAQTPASKGSNSGPVATPAALRYSILEHITSEGKHWDLVLEQAANPRLATWKLPFAPQEWPARCAVGNAIPATRLPDHRAIYLDYSGPISNNRGEVRQCQSGQAQWLARSEHRIVIALQPLGGEPPTLWQFTHAEADLWELRPASDNEAP